MSWTPRVCQLLDLSSEVKKMEWGPGGPEAGVLGVGSVGWTAARVRCGPSPGVVRLRGIGAGVRGRLDCLRLSRHPPIAPEFPAYVAPVACSLLIWSPGAT